MKRVLLTGGTGFVGANLTRRLLREGHEVHLLVHRGYTSWRIAAIASEVQLHQVDLSDAETLSTVVERIRPEWVFHLAAYGAYSSQLNIHKMIQTNITGTVNLVEACLKTGFDSFVNTGSSSEYGFKGHAPSETDWIEPNSNYAITKASATLFCRYIAMSRHTRLVTLRLYSVYGPYEDPTRLIPTLIVRGLQGELPVLVQPNVARDYVFIEDVDDAYMIAVSKDEKEYGAIYNIGTGIETSLLKVVENARVAMRIAAEPQWGSMPNRGWDTTVWLADNRLAREKLGWHPKYTFEQGLLRTIEWFGGNQDMTGFYQTHQVVPL
jgi:nucleoside-diphosphate-sugar epimerase